MSSVEKIRGGNDCCETIYVAINSKIKVVRLITVSRKLQNVLIMLSVNSSVLPCLWIQLLHVHRPNDRIHQYSRLGKG